MIETLGAILPFLIPLLGLSIYSVGLILERSQKLAAAKPLAAVALTSLLNALSARDLSQWRAPAGHPISRLLAFASEPAGLRQARAQVIVQELEDRLSYFPPLANIATLTGLFGTVCGMIVAFLALRSGGGADPASLAGGLGTALFATAFGLVTAIPSLSAHAIFQKRIQAMSSQMEAVLSALLVDNLENRSD